MNNNNCYFCGSECEIHAVTRMHNVNDYRCKYCGQYLIDRGFIGRIPGINKKENKFKIACILNERRLKGQSGVALSDKTDEDRKISNCPMISASELLDEFPKKHSDFLNRALLNLSRLVKPTQPFENIRLNMANKGDCLHLFTSDKQGCRVFLRVLAEQGYIIFNRVQAGEQWDVFCLTTKCWEKVENLQQTGEIHDSSNGGNTSMEWDVFICHASEDKEEFVQPLAIFLISRGLKVWYDKFTLTVGDSLRRSINKGLANSRYGIVVISPSFLHKEWPQKELDGLTAREVNGRKVILPVWHQIDEIGVREYSPILADRVATSSEKGIEKVVEDILKALDISTIANSIPEYPKDMADQSEVQLMARVIRNEIINYLRPSWLMSGLLITELSKSFPKHSVVDELHRMKEDGLVSWDSESLEDNTRVSLTKTKS